MTRFRYQWADCVWNVMGHAQKPDFVFRRNGRVHLSRRGRQFSRLLAAEVCASAVVMLDTPCSEVVWRVLDTHFIRQFPLPCVTLCHHISTGLYHKSFNVCALLCSDDGRSDTSQFCLCPVSFVRGTGPIRIWHLLSSHTPLSILFLRGSPFSVNVWYQVSHHVTSQQTKLYVDCSFSWPSV
jgi:hypothetical protein